MSSPFPKLSHFLSKRWSDLRAMSSTIACSTSREENYVFRIVGKALGFIRGTPEGVRGDVKERFQGIGPRLLKLMSRE